jgi:hypothetical protein
LYTRGRADLSEQIKIFPTLESAIKQINGDDAV